MTLDNGQVVTMTTEQDSPRFRTLHSRADLEAAEMIPA
jgi:hypothetical protein